MRGQRWTCPDTGDRKRPGGQGHFGHRAHPHGERARHRHRQIHGARLQQGLPEHQDRHRDTDLRPDAGQAGVVVPVVLPHLRSGDRRQPVDGRLRKRQVPATARRAHRQHARLRRGRLLQTTDGHRHRRQRPLRRAVLQLCARISLQHRRSRAGQARGAQDPRPAGQHVQGAQGRRPGGHRHATAARLQDLRGVGQLAVRGRRLDLRLQRQGQPQHPAGQAGAERLYRHLQGRGAAEQPELGLRRGLPLGVIRSGRVDDQLQLESPAAQRARLGPLGGQVQVGADPRRQVRPWLVELVHPDELGRIGRRMGVRVVDHFQAA